MVAERALNCSLDNDCKCHCYDYPKELSFKERAKGMSEQNVGQIAEELVNRYPDIPTQETRDEVLRVTRILLAEYPKPPLRHPEIYAGGAVYVAMVMVGAYVTQKDLADLLGSTEPSIRAASMIFRPVKNESKGCWEPTPAVFQKAGTAKASYIQPPWKRGFLRRREERIAFLRRTIAETKEVIVKKEKELAELSARAGENP